MILCEKMPFKVNLEEVKTTECKQGKYNSTKVQNQSTTAEKGVRKKD